MFHTALYNEHLKLNATITQFAGWQMPLHYGSQLAEHQAVRNHAGMFDVSHMGIIDVSGSDAKLYLQYLLANDVGKLKSVGRAIYTCMLNPQGGVIDDLIVYYLRSDYYRLVVNAACVNKDVAWLKKNTTEFSVNVKQRTDLSILAVQGPEAINKACLAVDAAASKLIHRLSPFDCIEYSDWLIARTGYTGEDGLEIILPASQVISLWQGLLQQGVTPAGLGARDSLRLQAGFKLYGMDMDETVTPLESGLAWTLALNPEERNFIGRAAVLVQMATGIPTKLIPVKLQGKGILRHGQKIYNSKQEIGIITSGSFVPDLCLAIGFARVAMPIDTQYFVEIRGKKHILVNDLRGKA